MIIGNPVAVRLPIRFIVLLRIAHEIGEGEAVMAREIIHGSRRAPEASLKNVGGAGKPRRERPRRAAIASPETPHVIAVFIVPFEERRRELAETVAGGADIPRLGDQQGLSQDRVLRDRREQRRFRRKSVLRPAEHGREVETKAVDAGGLHEMAHRIGHEAQHRRAVAGKRVAASCVVHEAPGIIREVAIIDGVVEAAQAHGRPRLVALGRVIEDHVENDRDAGLVQPRHDARQLAFPLGREARIGRHEDDWVISPGVGEAERRRDVARPSKPRSASARHASRQACGDAR